MNNVHNGESLYKKFRDIESGTLLVLFLHFSLENIIFEYDHCDLGNIEGTVHGHERNVPGIGNELVRTRSYKDVFHHTHIDAYRIFEKREIGLLINWKWLSISFRREIYGV